MCLLRLPAWADPVLCLLCPLCLQIADHTLSHLSVRGKSYKKVSDEIVGLRDELAAKCGISKE